MTWIALQSEEELDAIKEKSFTRPQVIFKHSTRCSISSVAKSRLDKSGTQTEIDYYYLDLIKFRSISNKIAEEFKIFHQSPQVLIIKNGECIYNESHSGIDAKELIENAMAA